jgi:hypothetical protein
MSTSRDQLLRSYKASLYNIKSFIQEQADSVNQLARELESAAGRTATPATSAAGSEGRADIETVRALIAEDLGHLSEDVGTRYAKLVKNL